MAHRKNLKDLKLETLAVHVGAEPDAATGGRDTADSPQHNL